jgi:hypothetical protein
MNTLIVSLQVLLVVAKVGFVLTASLLAAFIGSMVTDEIKEARLERSHKNTPATYQGRHRHDDPFIHSLVVELRENPNSLCYAHTEAWT